MEKELKKIYYTPSLPGSYGGVNALRRALAGNKATRKRAENWLTYQDAYTLHKPARKRFKRRQTIVSGIDAQWQADLIDVQRLKRNNDRYGYLLTVIDAFSKYAWVTPLKNKTGKSMVEGFKKVLGNGRRKPLKLQTDKGSEFTNRTFQTYLKNNQIEFFTTENEDIKAAIVERFNRTLKEKIWRYMTHRGTYRYVDVLADLVSAYNDSYHRSIGIAPSDVNRNNQERVWQKLYGQQQQQGRRRKQLKIGDRVRISKARRTFKKGYLPSWTEELFTVGRVLKTAPTTYVIKDDADEELKGSFYAQELQKVGQKTLYKIEAILKRQKNRALVKWVGYPDRFNAWIPIKTIQRL